jgi:hypothetical protein
VWSFVGLGVKFVKNLLADGLDLVDVSVVIVLGDVVALHAAQINVKTFHGPGDAVDNPPAKETYKAQANVN